MKKIQVKIGNVIFGGDSQIVVQTMCNTPTQDVEASFEQCLRLSKAGAQLIRLTTQGMKEVAALKVIKERLRSEGITTPLSADVHFTSDVALAAAEVADKVRINPGNFARDHETARFQFRKLTEICRERGVAIRIGVNHGSLGERIIEKYGDSPMGMKESALEWIKMAQEFNFDQIIVSLKASNTRVMTDAYRLLYSDFEQMGTAYPLHLGVTEAGNGESGRIKSAVGLSTLLSEGIGDTIRVSLTEDPQKEIPVARFIAEYFSDRKRNFVIPNIYRKGSEPAVIEATYSEPDWQSFILKASCDLGPLMLDSIADDIKLNVIIDGKPVK